MLAAWYFISIAISYVSLFLMAFTIYDLKLVLKNPFQNSKQRTNIYIAISVVLAVCLTTLGL